VLILAFAFSGNPAVAFLTDSSEKCEERPVRQMLGRVGRYFELTPFWLDYRSHFARWGTVSPLTTLA